MLHQTECAVVCGLIAVLVEEQNLIKMWFLFFKERFFVLTDNCCACHFLTLSPAAWLYRAACTETEGILQHNLFSNDGCSFRLNASVACSYKMLIKLPKQQQ